MTRASRPDEPHSTSSGGDPDPAVVVPPDGGWGWVVVAASFLANLLVDGVVFCAGLVMLAVQQDLSADGQQVSNSEVAVVSSLMTGLYLMCGPLAGALANRYGFRAVTVAGAAASSAGLALSYLAPGVRVLALSYGVLAGIGTCLVYMPAVLTVGFYFERWRALATGLALCGSGVGTLLVAPLTEWLLHAHGWRDTLLVHAALMAACALCGACFRPLRAVRVAALPVVELPADAEAEAGDGSERRRRAVERLDSLFAGAGAGEKLAGGLSLPPELRLRPRADAHTWMGVPSNTHYPTAAEVFARPRRPSAMEKPRPRYLVVPVAEDEEAAEEARDNAAPLLTSARPGALRRGSLRADPPPPRPLYRDDIFFSGSLARLPQYTSRTSLGYHLAVTRVPPERAPETEASCALCPEAVRRALATMLDVHLFRSPTFLLLALSGFLTMLGFFVPYTYVQKRALEHGMSKDAGRWLVSAVGAANVVGRVLCGTASSLPRVSPLWLNNGAVTLGGLATLASGLCYHATYQYAYCAIFGLAVACFASLRTILVVEYVGLERLTNCFGLLLLFQGAGALLGAPLAGALLDATGALDASFYAAGAFLLLSALVCYPLDCISRWERARRKLHPASPTTPI